MAPPRVCTVQFLFTNYTCRFLFIAASRGDKRLPSFPAAYILLLSLPTHAGTAIIFMYQMYNVIYTVKKEKKVTIPPFPPLLNYA